MLYYILIVIVNSNFYRVMKSGYLLIYKYMFSKSVDNRILIWKNIEGDNLKEKTLNQDVTVGTKLYFKKIGWSKAYLIIADADLSNVSETTLAIIKFETVNEFRGF